MTPRAILVGDAHLGQADPSVTEAFHAFLREVPAPGEHLVIMGDLFDFWFEYRRVVPRHHLATVDALRQVRSRGVTVTFIGGNHDRWGGRLFTQDLGIPFHRTGEAHLTVAGRRAYVHHGDGLTEQHWKARAMHVITRWPITVAAFHAVHPDIGHWIVDRLSRRLADATRDPDVLARAARAQAAWARGLLARRPDIELVAMGHTHRPAHESVDGRDYVNPGAFMDGGRYAAVSTESVELLAYPG